ncbi:MAG: serine acetyltransferase [Clostridiales bacterium]|nr:serine acetyltransferase [Clostridiales bacterium]MBE5747623.1 serine acetyltransferase [Clostridiales bacterium]
MNKIFKKDLYRYYGREKETFRQRLARPPQIKYLLALRKCSSAKNKISRLFYRWRLKKLQEKTLIQIPHTVNIGEGFYIGHYGRIIINPNVIIGKNVNIATGVTIGQENRGKRQGVPTISDNVWIGTNAVIVGRVTIGTDVLIAPNTFVNFDVPDHSVVVGNPARIIAREGATDEYVCNKV